MIGEELAGLKAQDPDTERFAKVFEECMMLLHAIN
jgi:hypothetical protein